jgi:hypothetical protein
MKIALAATALLLALATPAWGNVPAPQPAPGSEECNLCSLDPAVLQALIQQCATQPEGTACLILRTLAGVPISTAGT